MMSSKKTVFAILAALFFILSIVFFISSIQEVEAGRTTIQVANIQMTVFAAASAVLCGINIAGVIIISSLEENSSRGKNPNGMPSEIANMVHEILDMQRKEAEEKAAQEERQKAHDRQKKIEDMKQAKNNGDMSSVDQFIAEMGNETSMRKIEELWAKYQLDELYPETGKFIQRYCDMEKLYGKIKDIDSKKNEIRKQLTDEI